MLKLQHIRKVYEVGDEEIVALRDISIQFRRSEFVSILGHSGCGKTTLLNIIGGLDHYTSGDLVIGGKSTKTFTDRDWDSYRNHSIGFVFQSYNLIPHQSVLANVELALTISGVSRAERRSRAIHALQMVGLSKQLHKKPTQMSGGQMQRVAIARALVNDPQILLADEPTGALDSTTSLQIMELLHEIAKDRLVIMVTHNPELAEEYSTRIIRISDGAVVSDSDPYAPLPKNEPKPSRRKVKKPSMSFFTALSLSLKNLMTKKGRTLLTSFAGSIGIIGIALILSVSTGVNNYIAAVQRDTLSSYPIQIAAEQADLSGLLTTLMKNGSSNSEAKPDRADDRVYASSVLYEMMNSINAIEVEKNNLKKFRDFLETDEEIQKYISAVRYSYGGDLTVFTKDENGKIFRSDLSAMLAASDSAGMSSSAFQSSNPFVSGFSRIGIMEEMLPGDNGEAVHPMLKEQYDLLYGSWPTAYNELVLVVDENNEISDMSLYALGLKSSEEFRAAIRAYFLGESIDITEDESWTYEEICAHSYRLILDADRYALNPDGTYNDLSQSDAGLSYLYDECSTELRVTGIIRKNNDAVSAMLGGNIGYTAALTEYRIAETAKRDIVKAQLENPDIDVFTGLPFRTDESEPDVAEKASRARAVLDAMSDAEIAALYRRIAAVPTEEQLDMLVQSVLGDKTREEIEGQMVEAYAAEVGADIETVRAYLSKMSDEEFMTLVTGMARETAREQYTTQMEATLARLPDAMILMQYNSAKDNYTDNDYARIYDDFLPSAFSEGSYDGNLSRLGYVDFDAPTSIEIYALTFEDKDNIAAAIARYNASVTDENDEISYTDYVALLMSSISTIINAISYVLVAFVAISLVVSSIMIGIITYISVLERTKEIGILRAIGASKRDVSRVFNAETLIVGFVAGGMGILVSLFFIYCIINPILHALTGIGTLSAALPVDAAIILIAVSMALTLIAGLVPAGYAAKKDPVVALRTE